MYYDKLSDLGIKLTRRSGQEKCKCPQCHDGRKNKTDRSLSVNITNGDYHCHNCGWKGNVRTIERRKETRIYERPPQDVLNNINLKAKVVDWFGKRGISKSTLDKFMIFCKEEWMPQTQKKENCICFPYFRDGSLVNIKFRDGRKSFKMVKDAELIFYNLNTAGEKKHCIITEGEIDCMSLYEVGFGTEPKPNEDGELINEELSKWCVLSVPNGASKGSQKLEYLDSCSDWLLGFHDIVIATDGDDAGGMLAEELIRRLGVERCKTVSYPMEECVPTSNGLKRRCKDFNEVLQYLGKEVVVNTINSASSIPVDGVYEVDDIFPMMLENFKRGVQLAETTRFNEMDDYFRWKKGDVNLMVGYANWGKTFFTLQLQLTKSIWDGWKWAVFSPENYPATDFYDDMVEMYAGKWLDKMSVDEYTAACKFIGDHIYYVYPEDSHDIHSINEKFRYLVLKKGVDGVLIDPFNQLEDTRHSYQRTDEYLSEVLRDIKRFALLNKVCYNIIAHPKNPTYQDGKMLPVVDVYDIAGGAMWANKSDQIISYHRPRFHEDKNSPEVEIYLQKVKRKRTGGKLGHFPMKLVWGKKRYAEDITERMPCDPVFAEAEKKRGKIGATQSGFEKPRSLPYKDNDDDIQDIDF